MNTNRKLNVLGKSTQIISILITIFIFSMCLLMWFIDFKNDFGFWDSLAFLLLLVYIIYFGFANYNLYSNFKSLFNKSITDKEFKISWYTSVVVTLIPLIFFVTIAIVKVTPGPLVVFPLLLPQIILLLLSNPTKYHIKTPQLKMSTKMKLDLPKKMSVKEVQIISIITGAMFCIILGYLFSETQYYTGGGKKVFIETEYSVRKFNYIVGLVSFIISSGLTYLFLNKKYNIN